METPRVVSLAFLRDSAGQRLSLDAVLERSPLFLIGSDPRCHLILKDTKGDSVQVVISRRAEGYVAALRYPDVTAWVNGQPLRHPVRLYSGDVLQIGTAELIFSEETREAPEAQPVVAVPAREPALPIAPPKPARLPTGMQIAAVSAAPAARAQSLSVGDGIYFPETKADAPAGTSITGLLMGLATVFVIVGLMGYGLISTSTSTQAAAVSPYAFNDGNISILMFDADW